VLDQTKKTFQPDQSRRNRGEVRIARRFPGHLRRFSRLLVDTQRSASANSKETSQSEGEAAVEKNQVIAITCNNIIQYMSYKIDLASPHVSLPLELDRLCQRRFGLVVRARPSDSKKVGGAALKAAILEVSAAVPPFRWGSDESSG
jgi:hypothetical protein